MKILTLAVMLAASSAFAVDALPSDAPTLEPEAPAPRIFPPGELAPGRSVKLKAGEPAPFSGQLLDDQEQVRRSRVGARDAGELADLKKGNTIISTPALVAIIAGAVVAGAAAATAITVVALKPKPPGP